MTDLLQVAKLDLTGSLSRERFEAAFFDSFSELSSSRLIRDLWFWDVPARRLSTRIPYEDQWIFAACLPEGDVLGAIAVNVAMKDFQSATFGFMPPSDTAGCFEVVVAFNRTDSDQGVSHRVWRETARVLIESGFRTGFATCAPRPFHRYRRAGWKLIDQVEVGGEQRLFLTVDFADRSRERLVDTLGGHGSSTNCAP